MGLSGSKRISMKRLTVWHKACMWHTDAQRQKCRGIYPCYHSVAPVKILFQ